jgi:glycosyltransferase involved in cell wall biosynthesis
VHRNLLRFIGPWPRLFYVVKNCFRYLAIRFSRISRNAARNAAAIIAATEQTRLAIRSQWGKDSVVISEIGSPDVSKVNTFRGREPRDPIRIVWSGRLHSGKAPELLLRALALLDASVDWQLDILGDGPDRQKLKRFTMIHGIENRCRFHGWLPRSDAINELSRAHVLVLTSIYDLTSNVLVEAMNCALPVICLSSQSAASIIGTECGTVVSVTDPDEIITGLSDAIRKLYDDESTRAEMAKRSLAKARVFNWNTKAQALERIYADIH